MAKSKLTPAEEYPLHDTERRKCTRCHVIYQRTDPRCLKCSNPEFGVPLKTETEVKPLVPLASCILVGKVCRECPKCHAQEFEAGGEDMFAVFDDEDSGYPFHRKVWCCEACGHVGAEEEFNPPKVEETGQKLLF